MRADNLIDFGPGVRTLVRRTLQGESVMVEKEQGCCCCEEEASEEELLARLDGIIQEY